MKSLTKTNRTPFDELCIFYGDDLQKPRIELLQRRDGLRPLVHTVTLCSALQGKLQLVPDEQERGYVHHNSTTCVFAPDEMLKRIRLWLVQNNRK